MLTLKYHAGNDYAPTVYVDIWEGSQNVSNNTTTLVFRMRIERPSSISSSSAKSYKIIIDGKTVASGSTTIGGSGTKWIVSNTNYTVSHNGDGTKYISASFSMDIDLNWKGVKIGKAEASGGTWLTAIPRASSIASVSGTVIGSDCKVVINCKSASFTHSLEWSIGGNKGWTETLFAGKSIKTQAVFNMPLSCCSVITNAKSGVLWLRLKTFSGSKQIGNEVRAEYTVSIPNVSGVRPSFKFSTQPNSLLSAPFDKMYLQGYSKARTVFSEVSCKFGAGVSSYTVSAETATAGKGTQTTVDSGVLTGSGKKKVSVTVTDTRGFSTTQETQIDILPYKNPLVESFIARRVRKAENGDYVEDVNGTTAKIICSSSVTAIPAADGASLNLKAVKLYRKRKNAADYPPPIDMQSNLYYYDGCEPNVSYTFKISVTDTVGNTYSLERALPTSIAGMDIMDSAAGVAFGKYAEHKKALEIPSDWVFMRGGAKTNDFVIESGTSGAWSFKKWYSGKAELWFSGAIQFPKTGNETGLVGVSLTYSDVDLPFQVKNLISCVCSVGWHYTEWSECAPKDNNQIRIRLFCNSNSLALGEHNITIHAVAEI